MALVFFDLQIVSDILPHMSNTDFNVAPATILPGGMCIRFAYRVSFQTVAPATLSIMASDIVSLGQSYIIAWHSIT